jgi:hypothetical protein
MRKTISALSSAALLTLISLAGIMPAAAASPSRANWDRQDQYIGSFCQKYRGADQCNTWRADHANWTSEQYRDFYRRHQNDKEFATPEVAGLFGMSPGGGKAGISQHTGQEGSDNHIRTCKDTYLSYDPRTDSFLGYDGDRHQCQL